MGIKCVQFTSGDKVTASKEPKYSGSVWIQKSLHVSYRVTRHRDELLPKDPSSHHNSTCTGLAPHWGDGSPGTSGNGNLFIFLL